MKSPFYVVKEFISPLMCETIVDNCNFLMADTSKDGKPIPTLCTNEQSQSIIYDRLIQILPTLQEYYGIAYKGTEAIQFEWLTQGCIGEVRCENSEYLRKAWLRVRQRDLTCVLFLSDYQDKPPISLEFEVYGGKLEFPQHHFGFNPQRGTLIVFPSDPHFQNASSLVQIGDLFQARIQIAAKEPYLYDPTNFVGNFRTWFASDM
jgi:hypothetical protein